MIHRFYFLLEKADGILNERWKSKFKIKFSSMISVLRENKELSFQYVPKDNQIKHL